MTGGVAIIAVLAAIVHSAGAHPMLTAMIAGATAADFTNCLQQAKKL